MTKQQIKKLQAREKHLWKYFENNDAFSGEDCSMIEELIEISEQLTALDGQ